MCKPRLLACLCVFAAFGLQTASASADPTGGPPICPGTESPVSGNYKNLTIRGDQYVARRHHAERQPQPDDRTRGVL